MFDPKPLLLLAACATSLPAATLERVSGSYDCDWIGNSFCAGLDGNDDLRWVQNFIDAVTVLEDGTIITASQWDEAGRCVSLAKDGQVNRRLLKQYDGQGGHDCWGWGTASQAIAAEGETIYVLNLDQQILRFAWQPGDIDSTRYLDTTPLTGAKGVAMAIRDGRLVLAREDGRVDLLDAQSLELTDSFTTAGVQSVTVAADGSLWLIEDGQIVHRSAEGARLPEQIEDAGEPSSLAIAPQDWLVVCDDGPRQQVRVYDLASSSPRLLRRIGTENGLRSGTPGQVTDDTLWSLRGANYDATGRLHVASGDAGGCAVHSFDAEGRLEHRLLSLSFCDRYAFEPGTDGQVVHGVGELIAYDPDAPAGTGWSLTALSHDRHATPDDAFRNGSEHNLCAVEMRRLDDRLLIYGRGMTGGPYRLYAQHEGHLTRAVGSVGDGWALSVDARGDVWHGDGAEDAILRYPFQGWHEDGTPRFADEPERFPRPEGFTEIARVLYDSDHDVLYLSGYTEALPEASWGLAGSVLVRYDGWLAGEGTERWRIQLPTDSEDLHPKALTVAGDHVFAVTCKPINDLRGVVYVWDNDSGESSGTLIPDPPSLAGMMGWVDIVGGITALRRENGQYLVMIEENSKAKQLVYRWTPAASP